MACTVSSEVDSLVKPQGGASTTASGVYAGYGYDRFVDIHKRLGRR
jgi:hypothetical protein